LAAVWKGSRVGKPTRQVLRYSYGGTSHDTLQNGKRLLDFYTVGEHQEDNGSSHENMKVEILRPVFFFLFYSVVTSGLVLNNTG
jgi:hypothetical protein